MNAEYQLPPNGFQCLPLQRYSLEAAIADALYYNDLCSLDKGLENIQVALDIAKHPGLDDLAAAQDAENKYRQKKLTELDLENQKIQKEQANALLRNTAPAKALLAKAVNLSPSPLKFPPLKKGQDNTQLITLTNPTGTNITVTSINVEAPFSIASENCTQAPVQTGCVISAKFAPTEVKTFSTPLIIIDSVGVHKVELSGTGK